jgi:hypothetical protein
MGLRDDILAADDQRVVPVQVPCWPTCWVRVMTGTERNAFQARYVGPEADPMRNAFAELAVRCLCDETGARVFADSDADALGQKSGMALEAIWDVAAPLNGLAQEDIDELRKNS